MGKKIAWTDQAKADLRAIDQTTALRILHVVARYLAMGEGDVKHNVYANALNHGYDAREFLRKIPGSRICAIHIAGGKLISAPDGTTRLLDDHLHDVPDPVFDLLEEAAACSPHPLTVILERDGAYPSMLQLLAQIQRARLSLERGRARRTATQKQFA